MFALDLFNNDHERRLAEGAVDQLEQRRIDDLAMKMDDLVARAKKATSPEVKAALVKEFQKCKDERDSYYKIRNETMGYGGLVGEEGIPGNVPAEKIPGKEDLLKGKGRSYYEAQIQKKNSKVTDPSLDEHGGGIGPKQHWQDLMQENKLSVGDPIVVTGPNEFEGKTGEIYDFSPSGTFVVVDLYNHGKHSMHLSDIAYNEYADQEQDEEDDWYDDEELNEFAPSSERDDDEVPDQILKLANRWWNATDDQPKITNVLRSLGWSIAQVESEDDAVQMQHDDGTTYFISADDFDPDVFEGFQDFNKVEPYEVCLAGKCVKTFDYYEDARRFHDNWKKKLYNQGEKEKADKITLNPVMKEEEQKPGFGEFPPKQEITIIPPKKLKSGETYQDKNKYWQSQGQAPIYKTNEEGKGTPVPAKEFARGVLKDLKKVNVKEEGERVDPILIKALNNMPDGLATHGEVLNACYDAYAMELGKMRMKSEYGTTRVYIPKLMDLYKDKHGLTFNEAKADPTGSWVVYNGNKVKRFKSHTGAKAYAEKTGGKVASSEFYADRIQKSGVGEAIVASGPSKPLDDRAVRKMVWDTMKINADTGEQALQRALTVLAKKPQSRMVQDLQDKFQSLADRLAQGVLEGQTDYQKRRQRERDVDAGKPVPKQRQSGMTDYQKRRAEQKRQEQLGEDQDTSGVERAILNRIMTAHTDLLMKFGPEKVMQAAEEVAYNVGDVDEIGTSDVSAYVAQVKQILGVPEEVNEKWSQKYKSSINCANPKGFSQRAHCAGKKK